MDLVPTPLAPPLPGPAHTVPAPIALRSAAVTLILGWLLPGLGQFYVGRYAKGLVLMVTIGGLFYAGLAMTGFTCVNPHAYELEFVAHALLGGPAAAATWLTRGIVLAEPTSWFEAGRLYAAVAGLLNVVAMCDALGTALDHNRLARDRAHERRLFYADLAAREEERLAVASSEAAATPAPEAAPPVPDEDGDEAQA